MDLQNAQIIGKPDNTPTPQEVTKPPKVTGLIIFSIFFPPFGLFRAWRKHVLSRVMPLFVSISSLVTIIYFYQIQHSLLPLQSMFQGSFDTSLQSQFAYLIFFGYILCIFGFLLGLLMHVINKKAHHTSGAASLILFLLYLVPLALGIYIQFSFLSRLVFSNPAYNFPN